MVKNEQGTDFENVYRASNEQGDHEYYAYNQDEKALVKLEGLTEGNNGQVFFAGAQVNQLDNYAIGELQKQDVAPTKENIDNFHASIGDGNFGRGDSIRADAANRVDDLSDYNFNQRASSVEERESTGLQYKHTDFDHYQHYNAPMAYEQLQMPRCTG